MNDKEYFRDQLYQELRFVQQRRSDLQKWKLAFVTGLLGVGAVKLSSGDNCIALLFAPVVAVLFDILAMNSTVSQSKIRAFLREELNLCYERKWGSFGTCWGTVFAHVANNAFTAVIFALSFLGLSLTTSAQTGCPIVARVVVQPGTSLVPPSWITEHWAWACILGIAVVLLIVFRVIECCFKHYYSNYRKKRVAADGECCSDQNVGLEHGP